LPAIPEREKEMSKKQSPQVSVVVTCYNYGNFIDECLQSVLAQTFTDFEIIVINDGSTDNSEERILPYARSHENVVYISQKNAGQARAKNAGIRNARGEYIAFLDADDTWEAEKLERQIPLFTEDAIGAVYSKANYIDEQGELMDFELSGRYLQPRRGWVTEYLIFDNFVPFSSTIVKSSCLNEFGIFNESYEMGIDWDLWLRISTKYKFDYVDDNLINYRIGHSTQMSNKKEKRYFYSDLILNNFFKNYKVEKKLYKKVNKYTYENRGYYYATSNIILAVKYYIKAMKNNPFSYSIYKGLARILFIKMKLRSI
jgi:glycosyltransferase involved in cell wall biosynthesis